jgi:hypothetical protein
MMVNSPTILTSIGLNMKVLVAGLYLIKSILGITSHLKLTGPSSGSLNSGRRYDFFPIEAHLFICQWKGKFGRCIDYYKVDPIFSYVRIIRNVDLEAHVMQSYIVIEILGMNSHYYILSFTFYGDNTLSVGCSHPRLA